MSWRRDPGLIVLVAICTVVLAGCGSGVGSTRSATHTQSTSSTASGSHARNRSGATARHRRAQAHARGRKLSPAQRIALARAAALGALTLAGFPPTGIDVGANGSTVAIAIPAGSACTAQPGDEARIVHQIEQGAPFLSEVTVGVTGSGRSLSSYISARCPSSGLPSGRGRVVYRQTGRGFLTTSLFTVHARRWSIDFENDGTFFAAFVQRNGKFQPQAIVARQRAVGSKTFAGAGSFRLRISGSGRWTVRVRDGA
jgi:hypothetical protein